MSRSSPGEGREGRGFKAGKPSSAKRKRLANAGKTRSLWLEQREQRRGWCKMGVLSQAEALRSDTLRSFVSTEE